MRLEDRYKLPALTSQPNTLAIGDAIVSYLATLTYPDTTVVYKLAQLEAIKDIVDLVANGGVCVEVYGNDDDSQHHAFGGKMRDAQSWFILSMCSLDTPQLARQIYSVRDALVQPFQAHATLGNAGSVFHSQIKPNSGKFFRIFRNGKWYRSHIIELLTMQEWVVSTPPGVIA
jgi:hypothetical protein